MDHFAKPADRLALAQRKGSLQRNFQGYSACTQCDTVGLGISSVSQVADNFSQNTLDLQEYHDALSQDRLPVMRGYQSDDDDLLRREIIQNLICYWVVDTRKIEMKWGIDFERHFAAELSQLEKMQDDGLVTVGDGEIRIENPGRLLVRNVCMIFDRYQEKDKATEYFSGMV